MTRGQTKVNSNQTKFRRTWCVFIPNLQGVGFGSKAQKYDQRWFPSRNGAIRDRSLWVGQRRIEALNSLIRGYFERNWVWSETIASAFFFLLIFCKFLFSCTGSAKMRPKNILIRELSRVWWLWPETRGSLRANAGPLERKLWLIVDHNVSYTKLSKFIHWVRNMH